MEKCFDINKHIFLYVLLLLIRKKEATACQSAWQKWQEGNQSNTEKISSWATLIKESSTFLNNNSIATPTATAAKIVYIRCVFAIEGEKDDRPSQAANRQVTVFIKN